MSVVLKHFINLTFFTDLLLLKFGSSLPNLHIIEGIKPVYDIFMFVVIVLVSVSDVVTWSCT